MRIKLKIGKNKKLIVGVGIAILIFLLLCDIILIIADQLIGAEKGVIYGHKIFELIIELNVKAIFLVTVLYFVFSMTKFFKKQLVIILPKLKEIKLRRIKYIFQNILVPIVSMVILILLIELAFFFIQKVKNAKNYTIVNETFDKKFYEKDTLMGYKTYPNLKIRCNKELIDTITHKTVPIFDVTYTTDSIGNRLINIEGMQNRNKYALFFGCSFTFGIGVGDKENSPYYFAKSDSDYCVYNFGFTGYGPQNMLAKFKFGNIKKSIRQDSGICIYIYINSHVARAIGDKNIYTFYGKDLPYFNYKDDSLCYLGPFSKNRKFTSMLYWLMEKSNFITYFNINFPLIQLPKHYKLTCDIIYQSYIEYKKQFHNENFYVVLYPSNDDIYPYLKNYNIKIIDLSKLFKMNDKLYYLSDYDRHPTALAHRLVCQQLIKEISMFN